MRANLWFRVPTLSLPASAPVNQLSSNCNCLVCPESFAGLRSRFDHLPAAPAGQTQLSLLLWPGGGVLRALLVESLSRTTWPAQPGRLVGSGSRLASFLPALQRGVPVPGPSHIAPFFTPLWCRVQGSNSSNPVACASSGCPICWCCLAAATYRLLDCSMLYRRKLQYNMNCATPGDGTWGG